MKKYLGVVSIAIVLTGIILCFLIYPDFSKLQNFSLSDFGVIQQTALLFNLALIIGGVLNLIYADYLRKKLKLKPIISILLYISAISSIGVGLTPYNLNSILHDVFAVTLFYLYPVALFFVGSSLTKKKKIIQGLSIICLIAESLAFYLVQPKAFAEVIFGVFILVIMILSI